MVMTVPSETFSATAAESALRPCSDLVSGRPARLRGSTPSIKTPSLQSYHPPCIIASCGSNTGVWPQRHHDLYSSLLRYVYIHSLFIIWRYIYIYIEREREGDRSRGRRPDPSFTIPYPLRPPIMIIAAIIITCGMYIFIHYVSSGDIYRYVYIHPGGAERRTLLDVPS